MPLSKNHLDFICSISHSIPSYKPRQFNLEISRKPSLVFAEHAIIDHCLSQISVNVKESVI